MHFSYISLSKLLYKPGFLAFGPEFAHTPKLCHQANEYITQKDLLDAAKIYSRAIYALAR